MRPWPLHKTTPSDHLRNNSGGGHNHAWPLAIFECNMKLRFPGLLSFSDFIGGEKTNKHKQLFGIVPETRGGQIWLWKMLGQSWDNPGTIP